MIHSILSGHFGARVDGNIKLSNCFDKMRLKRSLRPLKFLMPRKSLSTLHAVFDDPFRIKRPEKVNLVLGLMETSSPVFFLRNEAEEVIEATDVSDTKEITHYV